MELSESADPLFTVLSKWGDLLDPAKIPPLYHYTTFDGLKGILKDDGLRATFSQSLNDGSEEKFGRSIISKYPVQREMKKAHAPPSPWASTTPKSVFVTCFCEDSDLLSMWHSYAGHGGGYALGFDGPQLNNLQRDDPTTEFGQALVQVCYGERLSPELKSLLSSGAHTTTEWLVAHMIKHEGFEQEKEWRYIVRDPPVSLMCFRSGQVNVKGFGSNQESLRQ